MLLAAEKAFSASARDQVVAIIKEAGYTANVLESYKGKGPLVEAIASADAVIFRSDIIDTEVLDAAKNLKLAVRAGAGYDNIDTAAAKAKNIAVMNTPGQNANAVGELVFGMLVYLARGKFDGKTGSELRGKTLGLHAFGMVGRAVATIAKGFGMKVYAFDPFVKADVFAAAGVEAASSIEDLYTKSQYLSLHIPATAETKGSIGKKLLSLMPKGATLINTARKEVINEAELLHKVFEARPDFRYVSDIAPSDADRRDAQREVRKARLPDFPPRWALQAEEANVQTPASPPRARSSASSRRTTATSSSTVSETSRSRA